MGKKKILLIIPTLDRSGAEKQLVLLATGLDRKKFDVHVALLTRTGPLTEQLDAAGIPWTLIGKSRKISFSAYFRLKRLIRRLQPDVVHTWLFAANAYGRKAAFACHVPRVICGERCVDPWKSRLHFMIDRHLAKKTDTIAVNSEGIREFYINHGLPADQFVVIPNAAAEIPASPWTRDELLTALDIPRPEPDATRNMAQNIPKKSGPFLIGIVARLWPQKRLKEALWSFDQLKYMGLDYHGIIIGDGPERERLLRYRSELMLDDRVHFLGHRNDVPCFLPHFDLVWCTSAYEGQSNSILEAMSCGVPVIASDIPGNRELVVHRQTGILIPEFDGDIQRRRTAVTHESFMLLQPDAFERRRAMGEAARERIRNEFSLEKMLQRYTELYSR